MDWTRLNPLTLKYSDQGQECLTSYITRLSASHLVRTRTLLRLVEAEFGENLTAQKYWNSDVSSVNGLGFRAKRWTAAVARATGTVVLEKASFLLLADVLSPTAHGLVQRTRRFCPSCFKEDLDNDGIVFDRIIWAFRPIASCPHHKVKFCTHCIECGTMPQYLQSLPDLRSCSTCGADYARIKPAYANDVELNRSTFFADELRALWTLDMPLSGSCIEGFLQTLVQTGLTDYQISKPCGLDHTSVRNWRCGKNRPDMLSLFALSAGWGTSLSSLFSAPKEAANAAVTQDGIIEALGITVKHRKHQTKTDHGKARKLLEAISQDISLYTSESDIVKKIGVRPATLHYHYSAELKSFSSRHREWRLASRRIRWEKLLLDGISIFDEMQTLTGVSPKRSEFVVELMARAKCSKHMAKEIFTEMLSGNN